MPSSFFPPKLEALNIPDSQIVRECPFEHDTVLLPTGGVTLPQIRAELDDARKTVFDVAAFVLMSLLDMKKDSQGHISHLIITKAEKAALQDQLDIMLKDEPDKGDHDFYISAAMVLGSGLQKGHKCADERQNQAK